MASALTAIQRQTEEHDRFANSSSFIADSFDLSGISTQTVVAG